MIIPEQPEALGNNFMSQQDRQFPHKEWKEAPAFSLPHVTKCFVTALARPR